MTTRIYTAPAAAGKSTYILERARRVSSKLNSETLIIVPSAANKYDLQRRLAVLGGSLGIRITTFSRFSEDVLAMTGEKYATISDIKRLRLMQYVVKRYPLTHYQPLVQKPGFIWKLAEIIHTL